MEKKKPTGKKKKSLQEKEKEAVQLFKTVINLDLVHLLRAPRFEEGNVIL